MVIALPLVPAALTALGEAVAFVGSAALAAWGATKAITAMQSADAEAERTLSPAKAETDTACATCPCERTVVVSRAASPQSAQHITDAQAQGHPLVLTYDPAGRTARSRLALAGIPTRPGMATTNTRPPSSRRAVRALRCG